MTAAVSSRDSTADALVVFGITGDLGRRMTIPALYRLERREALPCDVLGVGRQERSIEEFRTTARDAIEAAEGSVDDEVFERFAQRLSYLPGDASDPTFCERLGKELDGAERPVFYLAVPPSLFAPIVEVLAEAGLTTDARVVIEKPFGHDLASARQLNKELLRVLSERQIFRIDHFLGKEPVQDIVYLRFANELFEPTWNRHHVESIEITLAESFDVADRGSFYDAVGALRDVVQNHLLQVLALVTMEAPAGGGDAIGDRRLDVLRAVRSADPADCVRGQYEGYREHDGVKPDSQTETYVALRLWIDNWRWTDVPILIRAGKGMPLTATEVRISFRRPPPILLSDHTEEVHRHSHVTLRIGADAGASIGVLVKDPAGPTAEPVHLDVSFAEHMARSPRPYERLLGDVLRGDRMLFPRQAAVEESWRIVQPLLDAPPAVEEYEKGTWGPPSAERLAESYGGWRSPRTPTPAAATEEEAR